MIKFAYNRNAVTLKEFAIKGIFSEVVTANSASEKVSFIYMEKTCKECFIKKDLIEFYKHPEGVLGTLPRCKECIKKGRRTESERKMARISDNKRYHEDDNRKKYQRERSSIYRKENVDKAQARQLASRSARLNPEIIPLVCPITGGKVEHLHHYDYSKPFSVIPCSSLGHGKLHSSNPPIVQESWIVELPEYRNRVSKKSFFSLQSSQNVIYSKTK